MSMSPISSAAAGFVKQALANTSAQNTASAAMEEATETAYTTRQEAVHGDQAAVRKLARQQQQQQLESSKPAQKPGKGESVDHAA